jgi:hypothetical protein
MQFSVAVEGRFLYISSVAVPGKQTRLRLEAE